ncbi:MAG TPA: LacI family DNA-binding transcriptional regulator [Tepidisphaeraceae bacterium]|jgi:LacI family transcriptional regulator
MTVVDVAKLARVSVATVSRVMNNNPRVRPETTQQVREALAKLPAVQPRARRGPRQGKRVNKHLHRIALVTLGQAAQPWFEVPVMAAVMAGIMREAAKCDVAVQVEEAMDVAALEKSLDGRVEGALLFVSADQQTKFDGKIETATPIVRVLGESMGPGSFDHVGPDNAATGQLAFEYLQSRGCGSFSFMTPVPGWDLIRMRAHGFQAGACAAGAEPPMMFIGSTDAGRCAYYGSRVCGRESLEKLVEEFLRTMKKPAGLFVPRDADTVTVQRLLIACGAKLGSEVVVVSCDKEEIRLSALEPRPVSIDLGAKEIGARAVRQLLWRMEHPKEPTVRMQVAPLVTKDEV